MFASLIFGQKTIYHIRHILQFFIKRSINLDFEIILNKEDNEAKKNTDQGPLWAEARSTETKKNKPDAIIMSIFNNYFI
jgi:hypothetical protein